MDKLFHMEKLLDSAYDIGLSLIYALVVLFIGLRVIKYVVKMIDNGLQKSAMDKTVRIFLESLVSMALKVLLLITVASMFRR